MKDPIASWRFEAGGRPRLRWLLGARTGVMGRTLAALALALGLAGLAWAAGAGYAVRQAQAVQLAQRQAPSSPLPKKAAREALPELTTHQLAEISATVARLNLPWMGMFDDLEHFTPTGVAVLEVEPDVAHGWVRILVEAKSADDLLRYVDRLQAARHLLGTRVVKYEINAQDKSRPVRFELQAALPKAGLPLADAASAVVTGARP